jgi:CPA1 family monovalent cation:H+ antiporter
LNLLPLFQEAEPSVLQLETALIVGLLLITGIALLVSRLRFPYTVALVFAGLLLALVPTLLPIDLGGGSDQFSSELILALFVPPLIFEGALHIEWRRFRSNLGIILLMAVFGVLLGTFIVGGVVIGIEEALLSVGEQLGIQSLDALVSIPFIGAVAFGALISATDPVAVIAFFRTLGVGKRLSILVEGESLLNDGTSIVIFNLAVALGGFSAVSGGGAVDFDLLGTVIQFLEVSIGGLVVGLLIGRLAETVLRRTDNRLVETTITIPVAFGAYVLAERFHLSGILAVVAAGIYLGNSIPNNTNPTTKLVLYNFWEVLSFIFTSFIFLLIGWIIDIRALISIQNLVLVFSAVVAILVARLLVVYGMSAITNIAIKISNRRKKALKIEKVPVAFQHVMFWGGLRGAISLALALSLTPNEFGPSVGSQLQLMTFGVVLFTLIVQGTTIERLIKRLGLAKKSKLQIEKERSIGRYYTALAANKELNRLHETGIISGTLWKAMEEAQTAELTEHDLVVRDLMHRYPNLSVELALQARYSILDAERIALGEALRREVISEKIQEEMLEELDARIEALEIIARREGVVTLFEDDISKGAQL